MKSQRGSRDTCAPQQQTSVCSVNCWIAHNDSLNQIDNDDTIKHRHQHRRSNLRSNLRSDRLCKQSLLLLLLLCIQLRISASMSISINDNSMTNIISKYLKGHRYGNIRDQNTKIKYTPVVAARLLSSLNHGDSDGGIENDIETNNNKSSDSDTTKRKGRTIKRSSLSKRRTKKKKAKKVSNPIIDDTIKMGKHAKKKLTAKDDTTKMDKHAKKKLIGKEKKKLWAALKTKPPSKTKPPTKNKNGGKDFNNGKPGGGGGGGKNKNKTVSPSPTSMPSERPTRSPTASPTPAPSPRPTASPTPAPSPRPTISPTFHPTTDYPTIMKGNPTPSPTYWVESWVGEDLTLSLSTLTADEDQLEFTTDTGLGNKERTGLGDRGRSLFLSHGSTLNDGEKSMSPRYLKRIYAKDVLSGNEDDLLKLILTSIADTLCKYTDFVILSSATTTKSVNPATDEYTDYCKKDGIIIDSSSYYTKRATVIIAPVDALNDLSQVDANEFQVFEGTIKGKYLHWIQWDVKCPVVQISRTTLNEKDQDFKKALDQVKAETRLVMDEVLATNEMNSILTSKNDDILKVSASGWEVVKSIEFMKVRKENRNDDGLNGREKDDDFDSINMIDNDLALERYMIFQPIRVVGLFMMVIFFIVVIGLIKSGKRRDDKAWDARMLESSQLDGDLVSYEGVNFLLQNSRIEAESLQRLTPTKDEQRSPTNMGEDRQYRQYQEKKTSPDSQQKSSLTPESGNESGSFHEGFNASFEEVITLQKKTSILRKNKSSVTHLCVSPTGEIEASSPPNPNEFASQGNAFFSSSPTTTNGLRNPNRVPWHPNRAGDKVQKRKNSSVTRRME